MELRLVQPLSINENPYKHIRFTARGTWFHYFCTIPGRPMPGTTLTLRSTPTVDSHDRLLPPNTPLSRQPPFKRYTPHVLQTYRYVVSTIFLYYVSCMHRTNPMPTETPMSCCTKGYIPFSHPFDDSFMVAWRFGALCDTPLSVSLYTSASPF